ncbi:MAG TPA: hypothetical protein VJB56_01275 [Candidatus Paceibacterota bacterium]|uniref:Uncharacterized protein n=1 Tax=Candidatus Giovannonibacteria bacterium RIFCSPLOWO2_01_FULL_46_32 TaxID=1798353 RepID=A0A1F5XFG4_9BACT|nr:MAG: hypothetical protein A3B19_00535 [Candidatus Giovannonibacteria bacterium RIFCSPLOWO2_01_FULL_46_32]
MAKGFFCAERNTIFHYGVNPVPRFSSVAFGHCAAGFLSIQYVFTPLQEGYMDELWSACKPQDNLVTGFTDGAFCVVRGKEAQSVAFVP